MGAVANAIDNKLRARFAPQRLSIEDESSHHRGHAGHREGGESHFRVEIVSAAFEGQSRVARQRLVYGALKDEFAAGLHALALTTLTPQEAAARSS
jgi:BolA protein